MNSNIAQILIEARRIAESEVEPLRSEVRSQIERLDKLQESLTTLKKQAETPVHKDKRFWAGVLAIPSLLLAGWLAKAVSDSPAMLREIHRAFGTEAAAVAMVHENGSRLQGEIETQLAESLTRADGKLRKGLEVQLAQVFASKEQMESGISRELSRRAGVLHTGVYRVGLAPEILRSVCQGAPATGVGVPAPPSYDCRKRPETRTPSASAIFGARGLSKVDISIGIHVQELVPDRETSVIELKDVTSSIPDLANIISIDLDGAPIVDLTREGGLREYGSGSAKVFLMHLRRQDHLLKNDEYYRAFPLRNITIQVADNAAAKYSITAVVIVTTPNS